MDVDRFCKDNPKKCIAVALFLIAAISSAICLYILNLFALVDFIQLTFAITTALVVVPMFYDWFLNIDFGYVQVKDMIENKYNSLQISVEELRAYSRHLVFQRLAFAMALCSFIVGELIYLNTYIPNLFAV